MTEWGFRSNWRGKIILQRCIRGADLDGHPFEFWRDAKVSDMLDYARFHCLEPV